MALRILETIAIPFRIFIIRSIMMTPVWIAAGKAAIIRQLKSIAAYEIKTTGLQDNPVVFCYTYRIDT